jgi:hypothetical protein
MRTWLIACAVALVACNGQTAPSDTTISSIMEQVTTTTTAPVAPTTTSPPTTVARVATSTTTRPATTTTLSPFAPPDWLGTRVLPLRDDGYGEILPTPPELQQRRFATVDHLPPPEGDGYLSTIEPVPARVVARSTWREECPVPLADLRYLTLVHHGFDERLHTGELIVHVSVAEDIAWVFGRLFEAGFPIEQLRVTTMEDLDAPPTGDGNGSGAFGCRPVTGRSSGWSQHAYGLAVDLNPFHNPYRKGDVVIPELASYYLDRTLGEPGMIGPGSPVVEAFAAIGWKWGGNWTSMDDWMHFSKNGH